MCPYDLWRSEQDMSSLDVAENYARSLVLRERHDAGNLENAMHSVGHKTGAGYWSIWGLFHRRRKTADVELVGKLRAAVIRQLEAEVRHLEHELQILRSTGLDARDDEIASVVADLAKVRQTLGLGT